MSAATAALIEGYAPDAVVLWRGTQGITGGIARGITQSRLLAAAARLAARLPPSTSHVLSLSRDRGDFLLVFLAGLIAGRPCLMPPSGHAAAVATLLAAHPGALVFGEDGEGLTPAERAFDCGEWAGAVPQVPLAQLAAIAFTSGSTGAPQPQAKNWAALIATARSASQRFGHHIAIAATVPPQHMYGLETTVMMALVAGCAIESGLPFFPHDVAAALSHLPAPRLFVTTPVHLRALVAAAVPLPPLAMVLSATAPLPQALAQEAERVLAAPVYEIYGCTEAGSLATRRTTREPLWRLYPGLALEERDGAHWLVSDYLDPVRLSDAVQLEDGHRFRLLGRGSDLVKVAGKRLDLNALREALLALPGVSDAAVLMPEGDEVTARPAALVVGDAGEADLLAGLAQQFDPVLLPRPLKKVPALPRNAVGKLPRAALLELLRG